MLDAGSYKDLSLFIHCHKGFFRGGVSWGLGVGGGGLTLALYRQWSEQQPIKGSAGRIFAERPSSSHCVRQT